MRLIRSTWNLADQVAREQEAAREAARANAEQVRKGEIAAYLVERSEVAARRDAALSLGDEELASELAEHLAVIARELEARDYEPSSKR